MDGLPPGPFVLAGRRAARHGNYVFRLESFVK
jgi:hypothetical protein